jgi:hypothetical protein
VEVRWPNGGVEEWKGLEVNRAYRWKEAVR